MKPDKPLAKQIAEHLSRLMPLAGAKLAALMLAMQPVAAFQPPLEAGRFPYHVKEQDLRAVLHEFGLRNKLPVHISATIRGRVAGISGSGSAREFLDTITVQNDIDWYFDGQTLHFSMASDRTSRYLPMAGMPFERLATRLKETQLVTPKFYVKEVGSDVAMVHGPPRFREIVAQMLTALQDGRKAEPGSLPARPTGAPLYIYRGGQMTVSRPNRTD
jgi:type II secretory pathway component GspD/PulD (secretin)